MITEDNRFSVYEIIDHEGNPFYIGRTGNVKLRMYEHWRLATKRSGKWYTCKKIRKLIREHNYELKWNILVEGVSFDFSVSEEIRLIAEYKAKGIKLTNLTDGGEGSTGVKRVFTEEWKQKLCIAKQKLFAEGYVQTTKGKTYEEIHGKIISDKIKEKTGKKISEGIKNGTTKHNKGKTIEELVGNERALKLKKINSDTAKKTFTGTKQSEEHISKRIQNQITTKQNWTEEQKKAFSKKIARHKYFMQKIKEKGT